MLPPSSLIEHVPEGLTRTSYPLYIVSKQKLVMYAQNSLKGFFEGALLINFSFDRSLTFKFEAYMKSRNANDLLLISSSFPEVV